MCIRDRYYLQQYETVVEDTSYGGNVTTFSKTSTAPIQITASDSIRNLIETGVSMMTFFGPVSYTHLRAHETVLDLVCRLLLEKKKQKTQVYVIYFSKKTNTQ